MLQLNASPHSGHPEIFDGAHSSWIKFWGKFKKIDAQHFLITPVRIQFGNVFNLAATQ